MDVKVLLSICFLICCSEAYKVLLFYPLPMRSVNILGEATVRYLLEAGHEVTFITTFPLKENLPKNYREVDISENIQVLMGDAGINIAFVMKNPQLTNDPLYLQEVAYKLAVSTFENQAVQKLLQDPNEKFDIVISDLYETEVYSALAALYNCPMVWTYSMGAHWMSLRLVDGATNPAFATDYLTPDMPPFDFKQRLNKLLLQIYWSYLKWSNTLPKERTLYEKVFKPLFAKRGQSLPIYDDVIYNASLIFANDFIGNGLMPSVPQNFKFIGGFHIKAPPALPNQKIEKFRIQERSTNLSVGSNELSKILSHCSKDIQTILDNAHHGFIYFSMGSVWKSKDMPKVTTDGLLKVFGELKQTVIWKFEEVLPDLPKNVHILKWAPQPSILAHPKCLFFITHGGHLSSTETIHFGVPTIGIPIYFDQFINIDKAINRGYAIKVDLTYNLPNDLKTAMDKMLNNSTYKEKAKELSQIYHDRVVPPGKELVHWVEHVVRTRGAPHLRSPALMLPWYQKMFLDLASIIITVSIFIYYLLKTLFSFKKVTLDKKRN